MSTGYQIKEQNALHYITLQVVYWVDIFTRHIYRDIVIESLRYCQHAKGLEIYAYVIMSNHIHMIVKSDTGNLSDILRDFKKFTSKRSAEAIETTTESRKEWMLRLFSHASKRQNKYGKFQVWTHENHVFQLYSTDFIQEKVQYIHSNPFRSRFVDKPEDYIYSSARNYAGTEGLLSIILVDRIWKTYC